MKMWVRFQAAMAAKSSNAISPLSREDYTTQMISDRHTAQSKTRIWKGHLPLHLGQVPRMKTLTIETRLKKLKLRGTPQTHLRIQSWPPKRFSPPILIKLPTQREMIPDDLARDKNEHESPEHHDNTNTTKQSGKTKRSNPDTSHSSPDL